MTTNPPGWYGDSPTGAQDAAAQALDAPVQNTIVHNTTFHNTSDQPAEDMRLTVPGQPSFTVKPDSDLLSQCCTAGLTLKQSCRNGTCQQCLATLDSGHVLLRSGATVTAPGQILLCVSQPCSDITLSQLPRPALQQHWICQYRDVTTVLLAAGRQQPPRPGQRLALLQTDHLCFAKVVTIAGRNLVLSQPLPEQSSVIALAVPSREHSRGRGKTSLWRDSADRSHCLASDLSSELVEQILALAKQIGWRGHRRGP